MLNEMREHISRHTEILNLTTSSEKWVSGTKLSPELCRASVEKSSGNFVQSQNLIQNVQ